MVCDNVKGTVGQQQTLQRGKGEIFLSHLSLLIGATKVGLYAHGNDPVDRKKLMKSNGGEISKIMSLTVGEGLESGAKLSGC